MILSWLADALRDEGAAVEEHIMWKTRTMRPFDEYTPIGIIDHHTAGSSVLTNYPNPPYYPNISLDQKCNLTIRGNGVVVCLNAGWAADSGYGDRKVLAAVRADAPRPNPTDTYSDLDPVTPGGPNPGILGNAWFIDIEVQHLGNGSPIVPAQRQALILANAAICRHLGWDPMTRLIGHREWTRRKVDPKWGGTTNPMPGIRTDTATQLGQSDPKEDDLLPMKKDEKREDIRLLQIRLNKGFDAGLALTGVYDIATVAAVKAHLVKFTSAADLQSGEVVVSSMWEGLSDKLRSLACSGDDGVDQVARASATKAHQRLDKLHAV